MVRWRQKSSFRTLHVVDVFDWRMQKYENQVKINTDILPFSFREYSVRCLQKSTRNISWKNKTFMKEFNSGCDINTNLMLYALETDLPESVVLRML